MGKQARHANRSRDGTWLIVSPTYRWRRHLATFAHQFLNPNENLQESLMTHPLAGRAAQAATDAADAVIISSTTGIASTDTRQSVERSNPAPAKLRRYFQGKTHCIIRSRSLSQKSRFRNPRIKTCQCRWRGNHLINRDWISWLVISSIFSGVRVKRRAQR